MRITKRIVGTVTVSVLLIAGVQLALAASASKLNQGARKALQELYKKNDGAKILGKEALGILVFPGIYKAGFIVGGSGGDGVLYKHDKAVAYYRSVAASYGLQAGVQKFGYVLFFMNENALTYLDKSEGWEI